MHFSQRGCIAPMANLAPRDLLGVRDPAAVPDLPSSVGHALSGAPAGPGWLGASPGAMGRLDDDGGWPRGGRRGHRSRNPQCALRATGSPLQAPQSQAVRNTLLPSVGPFKFQAEGLRRLRDTAGTAVKTDGALEGLQIVSPGPWIVCFLLYHARRPLTDADTGRSQGVLASHGDRGLRPSRMRVRRSHPHQRTGRLNLHREHPHRHGDHHQVLR